MKIVHTNTIEEVGISHNEDIKKKVFIDKGYIPQLMNFSFATFKPGQFVETHLHKTMYEVFYIQSGKAEFIINGEKYIVQKGDCITIEAMEPHSQSNPFKENVTWVYFGIATD